MNKNPINLPISHYRINFSHESNRPEPVFSGNAWRGALGHALRRTACLTGADECQGCPMRYRCDYAYLFDTPIAPDASKLRLYKEAPHPYVLHEITDSNGMIGLHLVLIGHATQHASLMINTLIRSAVNPPGVAGRRLVYLTHEQWNDAAGQWHTCDPTNGHLIKTSFLPTCPAAPSGDIIIDLQTPLRIRRDGRHVGTEQFHFADLFGHALRRISLLMAFHTHDELAIDYKAVTQSAQAVALVDKSLQWLDLMRHSSRQHTAMKLGGVVGHIRLAGADIAPFWPYLWLGQHIHAGRSTTMGLGRYRIRSTDGTASFPALP